MRKSFWIILAVLFVAVSAPKADADTFDATFTITNLNSSCATCEIIPSATGPVVFPAPTPISILLTEELFDEPLTGPVTRTLPALSLPTTLYDWSFTDTSTTAAFTISIGGSPLLTIDYSGLSLESQLAGISESGTLSFAPVNAPEPSSYALMLLGVGLVMVMRKRIGQGLPQAG